MSSVLLVSRRSRCIGSGVATGTACLLVRAHRPSGGARLEVKHGSPSWFTIDS